MQERQCANINATDLLIHVHDNSSLRVCSVSVEAYLLSGVR